MMRLRLLPWLALATLGYACNAESKSENRATETQQAATGQSTNTSEEITGEAPGKIRLVLSGGAMAGTYEASCQKTCCSYGLAGKETFGLQYSELDKAEHELSSIQMIVENASGDLTTNEFNTTISFGDLLNPGQKFSFETRKGRNAKGSGTLSIKYQGDKATVTLKGKSAEGADVDLTVECMNIMKI